MADIQPKNTDTIRVNKIKEKTGGSKITLDNITLVDEVKEKTASNGVRLNDIVKFTTAFVPLTAVIDLGTSTAAEHIRQAFVKKMTSNGQNLTIGCDSAHQIDFQSTALTRLSLLSGGDLSQDATNGGNLLWAKASTIVTSGLASTTLTATGSAFADALALTAVFNNITTVAASTGVKLWAAPINSMIIIRNQGANALAVYPENNTTATINGGAAGASVSVAAATLNIFWKVSSTAWIGVEFAVAAA